MMDVLRWVLERFFFLVILLLFFSHTAVVVFLLPAGWLLRWSSIMQESPHHPIIILQSRFVVPWDGRRTQECRVHGTALFAPS